MKKTILLFALLFIGVNLNAQKYIKLKKTKVPYTQAPLDFTLQDNYKKYYIRFSEDELKPFKNKIEIENLVNLPGFEKSELLENADFSILIEEVTNGTDKYKSSKNKKTSKDGAVSYTYTTSSDLISTFRVKLIDRNGNLIDSKTSSNVSKISSNVCASQDQSIKKYKASLEKSKTPNRRKGFTNTFNSLKEKYCFVNKTMFLNFVGFKFKKYDYKELNLIAEQGIELLSKKSTPESIEKVKGFITIWENELKSYDADTKKTRINTKIKDGLMFNIALGYFHINNLESSLEYMNKVEKLVLNGQVDLSRVLKRNIEAKR